MVFPQLERYQLNRVWHRVCNKRRNRGPVGGLGEIFADKMQNVFASENTGKMAAQSCAAPQNLENSLNLARVGIVFCARQSTIRRL
jgi:hypothetical protein